MGRIRTEELLAELAGSLNALAGVFSTPQWGGRAYKLPGPGGNRKKPKLVAHVGQTRTGEVTASFKLPPARAAEVVEELDWIEPHSFRTLAPSGWVTATVTTKRQSSRLKKLLAESRALHGGVAPPANTAPATTSEARHIDQVMAEARAKGWKPPTD